MEIRALLYYQRCGWCDGQGAYTVYLGLPEAEEGLQECERCKGIGYECDRRADSLKDLEKRGIAQVKNGLVSMFA